MVSYSSIGARYSCQPTISGDGNSLETVSGDHEEGKTNAEVDVLYVTRQALYSLPKGIAEFFPNLIGLLIFNSKFSEINAEDLEPFPNLLYFDIYDNNLDSVDGDLFKYTRKLNFIRIFNSQLEHVGEDLLTGLEDLTWVDFRNNPCVKLDARTKEGIEELNSQLPINCSPLVKTTEATTPTTTKTTTEPSTTSEFADVCCASCLKRINEQAEKWEIRIHELEEKVRKLASKDSAGNKSSEKKSSEKKSSEKIYSEINI